MSRRRFNRPDRRRLAARQPMTRAPLALPPQEVGRSVLSTLLPRQILNIATLKATSAEVHDPRD
eukprot:1915980-Prorocentrum_lima.AAC.1